MLVFLILFFCNQLFYLLGLLCKKFVVVLKCQQVFLHGRRGHGYSVVTKTIDIYKITVGVIRKFHCITFEISSAIAKETYLYAGSSYATAAHIFKLLLYSFLTIEIFENL